MLTRLGSRALRTILNGLKECVVILAVGVLGSQLLMAINSGVPIGTEAIASSRAVDPGFVRVSSLYLDIDPARPGWLRSIYVRVTTLDGCEPENLELAPTPTSPAQYDCHAHREDASWHCPTPGLTIADLEQIVVSGS